MSDASKKGWKSEVDEIQKKNTSSGKSNRCENGIFIHCSENALHCNIIQVDEYINGSQYFHEFR